MVHPFGGDILKQGNEVGVLVVHGITVSPSYMQGVIEPLARAGFTVLAPRLAGHGSDQADLKNYGYPDWLRSVEQATQALRDRGCTQVFAVGHSLGALLSARQAQEHRVDGLVTISLPYYIFGYWQAKLFSIFCKGRLVQMNDSPIPQGLFRYEKMCGKSVGDLLRAMGEVNDNLRAVTCPALVVYGTQDKTVIPSSAKHVYHNISSQQKQLLSIHAPHQCTQKAEHCDQYMPQVVQFIHDLANRSNNS